MSNSQRDERAAERKAAALEKGLREGRDVNPLKSAWEILRDRCTAEVADTLARATGRGKRRVLPGRNEDATAAAAHGRSDGQQNQQMSQPVAGGERRGWAQREAPSNRLYGGEPLPKPEGRVEFRQGRGVVRSVPAIRPPKLPRGGKIMRGRPVALEEFERMLMSIEATLTPEPMEATPKAILQGVQEAVQWRRFRTELWWSGLRLGEALALS